MRSFNASSKFIASVTEDFDNSCGTARGTINGRFVLKARIEADQTMTAMLMDHDTMKIDKVRNACTADVRALYATACKAIAA